MGSFNFEPLCETDEKNEKHFSEIEIKQLAAETRRRILDVFHYLSDREIAFLLKTNSARIKSFTRDGELPSTELLLSIHKITGVSIDWLLTGEGVKYTNPVKPDALVKRVIPSQLSLHQRRLFNQLVGINEE